MKRPLTAALISIAALGLAGIGVAREAGVGGEPPTPRVIDGVSVVSGGVGSGEARAMARLAEQYPLSVRISGRGGEFHVADRLTVTQGQTVVTELHDAGPWVLMDLRPGRYTFHGEFDGVPVQRDVIVGVNGTAVQWVLPSTLH